MNDIQDEIIETHDLFENQPSNTLVYENIPIWVKPTILLIICLILGILNFAMSNIDPFQNIVVEHMKLNEFQYNAISSFYSIPNIILVIFAGKIVDKIGYRSSLIIATIFCFVGQILIFIGLFFDVYPLLLTGRLIYGIGGESVSISSSIYQVLWFKGSSLNVAIGLQLSVSRFMTFMNMHYSMDIFDTIFKRFPTLDRLKIASYVIGISTVFCGLMVLLSCISAMLDLKYKYKDEEATISQTQASSDFNWKTSFNMSRTFWLFCLFCFIYFFPFGSYLSISPLYYQLKYKYSTNEANYSISINSFTGIFMCLLFGFISSRTGYELLWFTSGSCICLIAHTVFSLTFISPKIFLILRAIGHSIVSCTFWTSINFVVPLQSIGLAYGIIQSFQNFGLSVSPFIIAYLVDNKGYFFLELFVQYCFTISIAICFAMMYVDKIYTCGVLTSSPTTKQQLIFKSRNSHIYDIDND